MMEEQQLESRRDQDLHARLSQLQGREGGGSYRQAHPPPVLESPGIPSGLDDISEVRDK